MHGWTPAFAGVRERRHAQIHPRRRRGACSPRQPPRSRRRRPSSSSSSRSTSSRPNLFDEYRPQFTGGLARLASGTVFRNGYQSHAATETCPGHSTILTGDHPARTGIIANAWIDQSIARTDKSVYCAEDETAPGQLARSHYKVSPEHLLVPTLGELMKARWPASRNVAVSGKDRAAVMMSGHNADQRWYWDGKQFDTDLPARRSRAWSPKVNAAVAAALAAAARSRSSRRPICQAKARAIADRGRRQAGRRRAARAGGGRRGGASALRPSSTATRWRLPPALVDEMQLGRGADSRPARDQPVGDRLCRPHLRHRGRGDVPPAARARPRDRRLPRACSTAAGSIMRWR